MTTTVLILCAACLLAGLSAPFIARALRREARRSWRRSRVRKAFATRSHKVVRGGQVVPRPMPRRRSPVTAYLLGEDDGPQPDYNVVSADEHREQFRPVAAPSVLSGTWRALSG